MKICIFGSGAYGLALASIIHKNGHAITMWSNLQEEKDYILKERKSVKLGEYKIPDDIDVTLDIKSAIKDKDLIIIAVPAFAFDNVSKEISKYTNGNEHFLIATKGIEQDTCLLLTDVFKKYNSIDKLAVMSGPTFATDIVTNVSIGFTLASNDKETRTFIKEIFENEKTVIEECEDMIGVEICSSIKNVMAIASGMLDNECDSTKALFLTKALNEIKLLISLLGGKKETILSLAGMGDILMTCTSPVSRNYSFGKMICYNSSAEEIKKYLDNTTVEGFYTLKSIKKLIEKNNIKMPIIDLIYDIIINNKKKEDLLMFLTKENF